MVDRAYSMAEWSMNGSAPSASPERRGPGAGTLGHEVDAQETTAADLAALDSMYTALSSFGLNQV